MPVPPPGVEMAQFASLMDSLVIYAVRIGYRTDSSPEEREFGDDMMKLSDAWQKIRAEHKQEENKN